MKSVLFYSVCLVIPVLTTSWNPNSSDEDHSSWKHFHSKRHLPMSRDSEVKKRSQPPRYKKKPVGSLIPPLREDDIDNDETVSVAIGPPLIKPRYDRVRKKLPSFETSPSNTVQFITGASHNVPAHPKISTSIVVDILTELGKEFLARQVSEDFVFGQYVGNALRNLTVDDKVQLQHSILDLIMRYQKKEHQITTVKVEESAESSERQKVVKKTLPTNSTKAMFTTTMVATTSEISNVSNDTEEWSVLANLDTNDN